MSVSDELARPGLVQQCLGDQYVFNEYQLRLEHLDVFHLEIQILFRFSYVWYMINLLNLKGRISVNIKLESFEILGHLAISPKKLDHNDITR